MSHIVLIFKNRIVLQGQRLRGGPSLPGFPRHPSLFFPHEAPGSSILLSSFLLVALAFLEIVSVLLSGHLAAGHMIGTDPPRFPGDSSHLSWFPGACHQALPWQLPSRMSKPGGTW